MSLGSGTGLKSGQYQKEPRVPKQTDPSLERRVPLQSAIPAQLPEKNKQVVDKFGRCVQLDNIWAVACTFPGLSTALHVASSLHLWLFSLLGTSTLWGHFYLR